MAKLNGLEQFIGTEQYHRLGFFRTVATDGVAFVMENGHSWLVTDAIAVIETELTKHEFLVVRWNHTDRVMTIGNGNGKELYRQEYEYSDSESDVDFYWTNGVLMLTSEY